MRRISRVRSRAALGLFACAVVACGLPVACGRPARLGPSPRSGALAVVLTQAESTSELAVIDLERMREVRRVRLRSRCLSIDGDGERRVIVTAQCGGVGSDADSTVGVIEVDSDAAPRYIELGIPNPLDVAVADSSAFVVHGFEQPQGTVASLVSIADGVTKDATEESAEGVTKATTGDMAQRVTKATTGDVAQDVMTAAGIRGGRPERVHVPLSAGRPEAHGTSIVLPTTTDPAGESGSLRWLEPAASTLESHVNSLTADAATVVTGQFPYPSSALLVVREDRTGEWRIERHAHSGRQSSRVLPAPRKGYFAACTFGDRVAVADADGLDPKDPGRDILVLDGDTLDELQRIALEGTPAAMRGWGMRLVVADAEHGMIHVYEPGATAPARSLAIEGLDSGGADMVVFD